MTNNAGGTQSSVAVPSGGTGRTTLSATTTQVCQLSGAILFDTARSFISPTANNKAVLQDVVTFGENPPGRHTRLLIVGHTDSVGRPTPNQELSERRARSVLALLQGNVTEWEMLFTTEGWSTPELTLMVTETGEADPSDPDAVSEAVNRHRGAANRAARADLFRRYFESLLGRSGTPAIQFVPRTPPWIGCGEQHLLRGSRGSPSRDPSQPPIEGAFEGNRRVEFFFFEEVSIPIDCPEYPSWTLACVPFTPPPPVLEWFVSASTGRDTVGHGTSRSQPFKTIQFAINHVTELGIAGTDVINVMNGNYRENIRLESDITLRADADASPTVERASSGTPVITCDDVQNVGIEGLIINGRNQESHGLLIHNSRNINVNSNIIRRNRSDSRGGGILVDNSSEIEISEGRITQNFAPRGGGVAVIDSTQVTVGDNDIEENEAGTISTAVTRLSIDANIDIFPPDANLEVFDIVIGDAHGGGIYLEGSREVFINNNRIRNNQAILFGGGIAVDNRPGFTGSIVISGNEISCNQVSHGNLQPLQHPTISCNRADMNDPLLERMEEETIDRVAGLAIRLLHGVGIESGLGGGIALRHVSPTTRLLNNRIGLQNQPNRARRGGGIECYTGAYPHIEENNIAFNLTSDDGAGIAIDQFDPFLPASEPTFLGFRRGQFFPRQIVRLVNNRLRFNRSIEDGGGLYATGNAQVDISGSNTLIEGNRAGENGGGIRVSYATSLVMRGARIINNQSNFIGTEREGGGGVAARNAELDLQDCEFVENIANNFAGGAIFCNSAFEGGFNEGGFIPNQDGQFDDIMRNDYGFGPRRYRFSNCRGSNNEATGRSGAGGFLYSVRVEGDERLEVIIQGSGTAIGTNRSEYDNAGNPGGSRQKRGNVVIELSGRSDAFGLPQDRVNIFGDVSSVPVGIALSTPAPDDRAVVVIHHDGSPDDHPTNFPYSNIALSIADVQPRIGSVAGGTPITITGNGFLDLPGTEVYIANHLAVNTTVVSPTEITAETPPLPIPMVPGPVDVEVHNADGQIDIVPGGFEYVLPPSILDVQPRQGTTLGGTNITITGSHFLAGAEVLIAGEPALVINIDVSAGAIEAITPALPAPLLPGLVDVEVRNPDGQSDIVSDGFEYVAPPPPIIFSVQPSSGPISGGTDIIITGSDFLSGAEVFIAGEPVLVINIDVSAGEIEATTPPLPAPLSPGFFNVEVRNPDGQSGFLSGGFEYTF